LLLWVADSDGWAKWLDAQAMPELARVWLPLLILTRIPKPLAKTVILG